MDSLSIRIKYYKKLLKKQPNDKRNFVRKHKLIVLKEQKKIKNRLKRIVNKKLRRELRKEYTKLSKMNKKMKSILDELGNGGGGGGIGGGGGDYVQGWDDYNLNKYLTEKYEALLNYDNAGLNNDVSRLAKGLATAFEMAGIVENKDMITINELKLINEKFGIDGLSFGEVLTIIYKYYNRDIEEIFYNSDRLRNDVFDGAYFKNRFSEMIKDIRDSYKAGKFIDV